MSSKLIVYSETHCCNANSHHVRKLKKKNGQKMKHKICIYFLSNWKSWTWPSNHSRAWDCCGAMSRLYLQRRGETGADIWLSGFNQSISQLINQSNVVRSPGLCSVYGCVLNLYFTPSGGLFVKRRTAQVSNSSRKRRNKTKGTDVTSDDSFSEQRSRKGILRKSKEPWNNWMWTGINSINPLKKKAYKIHVAKLCIYSYYLKDLSILNLNVS